MRNTEPSIRVNVDPKNPGQFFACCGIFELAHRLWDDVEAWFEQGVFCVSCSHALEELMQIFLHAELAQIDKENDKSTPISLCDPFPEVRFDWWQDKLAGGQMLKVWAGSMENYRISIALQNSMRNNQLFRTQRLFDVGIIVYKPDTPPTPQNKVEPFCFDARRAANSHSRDIGFSTNDLSMTTTAFPAVELLCLIGLQRFRPAPVIGKTRLFDYYVWREPLSISIASVVITGQMTIQGSQQYQFENWYRSGQEKHKAFRYANKISILGVP